MTAFSLLPKRLVRGPHEPILCNLYSFSIFPREFLFILTIDFYPEKVYNNIVKGRLVRQSPRD